MMTSHIWMEARCGSVAGVTSENWQKPRKCHETAEEGGFFKEVRRARRHFLRQGWKIIDDEWWCPVCAKAIAEGSNAKAD